MRRPRLTMMFLLYVSLDLSSPFVPGAFRFDPDESIEGLSGLRERVTRRIAIDEAPKVRVEPAPRSDAHRQSRFESAGVGPRVLGDWLVDLRRVHAAVADVSPPSEDH